MISIACSKSSSSMLWNCPTWMTPALQISRSITPKRSIVASISRCTSSLSATSQRTASTSAPRAIRSCRARSNSSSFRAHITRRAPSPANSRAISNPRPLDDPVITATFPERSISRARTIASRTPSATPIPVIPFFKFEFIERSRNISRDATSSVSTDIGP